MDPPAENRENDDQAASQASEAAVQPTCASLVPTNSVTSSGTTNHVSVAQNPRPSEEQEKYFRLPLRSLTKFGDRRERRKFFAQCINALPVLDTITIEDNDSDAAPAAASAMAPAQVKSEDPQWMCPVCLNTCTNHVQATLCGHLLCDGCADRVLKNTESCPVCRSHAKYTDCRRVHLN